MNAKRIKAIAKLVVLFGTPLAVVLGLFCWGVAFGATHRHTITTFERDWLGLDVEVPPPLHDTAEPDPQVAESGSSEAESDSTPDGKGEQDTKSPEVADSSKALDQDAQDDSPTPRPNSEHADVPVEPPAGRVEVPESRADALAGELAHRLQLPVTIEVKVLVDPALAESHPDWIDYVQRTVANASLVYQKQFGIVLEPVSIGRWPIAVAGITEDELLEDLRERPLEAGQVLVGLTAHPLKQVATERPAGDDPFNGAYAVIGPTAGHQGHPHLHGLLRELARLMGARDVDDPEHPDYRAGSWMRIAPVSETQPPWIDAANRQRVLERKDRPFRPSSAAGGSDDEDATDADETAGSQPEEEQ